jgi:hypothetical protein
MMALVIMTLPKTLINVTLHTYFLFIAISEIIHKCDQL